MARIGSKPDRRFDDTESPNMGWAPISQDDAQEAIGRMIIDHPEVAQDMGYDGEASTAWAGYPDARYGSPELIMSLDNGQMIKITIDLLN
jgi:hypothetical protein